MPEGYYVPFSAVIDAPYWLYKFGQGPKANNAAGIIPKGGLIHVQGPAGAWGGTHQSAYLMGVGRIIVKIGDFQPAPARDDEFLSSDFRCFSGFLLHSQKMPIPCALACRPLRCPVPTYPVIASR